MPGYGQSVSPIGWSSGIALRITLSSMSIFFTLFVFGVIAGAVGKTKGSSFFIWFLIGFCLPLVGLIAAVLYRSENAELRRECPECGFVQPVYVQVCTRCGRDLDFPEEPIVSRDMERHLRAGGANGTGE